MKQFLIEGSPEQLADTLNQILEQNPGITYLGSTSAGHVRYVGNPLDINKPTPVPTVVMFVFYELPDEGEVRLTLADPKSGVVIERRSNNEV